MSKTDAPPAVENGKLPEAPPAAPSPEMQLPPGTLSLPPALVAVLSRLLQSDQRVQDVLYAYLQGKGETGPLTLVLPVVLLVRPKE